MLLFSSVFAGGLLASRLRYARRGRAALRANLRSIMQRQTRSRAVTATTKYTKKHTGAARSQKGFWKSGNGSICAKTEFTGGSYLRCVDLVFRDRDAMNMMQAYCISKSMAGFVQARESRQACSPATSSCRAYLATSPQPTAVRMTDLLHATQFKKHQDTHCGFENSELRTPSQILFYHFHDTTFGRAPL